MPTILETLRRKRATLLRELGREELEPNDRRLHLAELVLKASRLERLLTIRNERIYELTVAPKPMRGMSDLTVRLAVRADAGALARLSETPEGLIRKRLKRGDLAYIGEIDGELLAQSWFHRGPEPFPEDQPEFPPWEIPEDAYWSYHAFTRLDARRKGVFVKVFYAALHELLGVRGAKRVRCMVNAANTASIALHERSGFKKLGDILTVSVPGARLLTWQDGASKRRWFHRHAGSQTLHLPPEA